MTVTGALESIPESLNSTSRALMSLAIGPIGMKGQVYVWAIFGAWIYRLEYPKSGVESSKWATVYRPTF